MPPDLGPGDPFQASQGGANLVDAGNVSRQREKSSAFQGSEMDGDERCFR